MVKRNNAKAVNWNICNDIQNIFRKLKGEKLRPKTDNPYNRQEEHNGV